MPEYNATDLTITVKFNAQLDSEKAVNENSPKYSYTAEVTYASVKDAVEKAGKFTVWTLARHARKGELPRTGKVLRVNGDGEYTKTDREIIADMTPEQRRTLFLELQAQLQAEAAAEMVQGTPEVESTDSDELTEEELEQATAPVPVKKDSAKRTTGKNS